MVLDIEERVVFYFLIEGSELVFSFFDGAAFTEECGWDLVLSVYLYSFFEEASHFFGAFVFGIVAKEEKFFSDDWVEFSNGSLFAEVTGEGQRSCACGYGFYEVTSVYIFVHIVLLRAAAITGYITNIINYYGAAVKSQRQESNLFLIWRVYFPIVLAG